MKISRTIACCLLLSVSVLVFGCDGGGDGGSSSDLQAGTWTGEGVSFTINHIAAVIVPAALGLVWMVSPTMVFLIGTGFAICSLILSQNIPSRPVEGNEVNWGRVAVRS